MSQKEPTYVTKASLLHDFYHRRDIVRLFALVHYLFWPNFGYIRLTIIHSVHIYFSRNQSHDGQTQFTSSFSLAIDSNRPAKDFKLL